MTEEKINREFRLKNKEEIRNYFIEEKNQNELMSMKHKKVCRVLNYIKHALILVLQLLDVLPFLLLLL